MQKWASDNSIKWEFRVFYNLYQNKIARKANETIFKIMRTIFVAANFQKIL